MYDNIDVDQESGTVPPADEVPRVRGRPPLHATFAWSCPLTGAFLECHRHLERPNRKDCFNCGYTWGYETCYAEITDDGDEGEP